MPRKRAKLPDKYRFGMPAIEGEPAIQLKILSSPDAPKHLIGRRTNKILDVGPSGVEFRDKGYLEPHLIELTRSTREIADGRAWAVLELLEELGLTADQCDRIRHEFREAALLVGALHAMAAMDREHRCRSEKQRRPDDEAEREDEAILVEVERRQAGSKRSTRDVALDMAIEADGPGGKAYREQIGVNVSRGMSERSIELACQRAAARRAKPRSCAKTVRST